MIYIDKVGHMVADTLEELHVFASRLGLKREWYQDKKLPHYDLTTVKMKHKAKQLGAIEINSRKIVIVSRRLSNEKIY